MVGRGGGEVVGRDGADPQYAIRYALNQIIHSAGGKFLSLLGYKRNLLNITYIFRPDYENVGTRRAQKISA